MPLGHVYLGQMQKAVIWIAISLVSGGIGGFFAALDAYLTAKKLQRGEPVGELEFFPRV